MLAILVCATAQADSRLILIQQQSWENHRGFVLDLENNGSTDPAAAAAPDGRPLPLVTLRLGMGAADGKSWHYVSSIAKWELGHTYHVKAIVDSAGTSLSLDGQTIARGEGVALAPDNGTAVAGLIPDWANATPQYTAIERSAEIQSDGRSLLQHAWAIHDGATAVAQRLFAPPLPWNDTDLHLTPGQSLVLDTTFSLEAHLTDLHAMAPFVDRYGQDRYGQWPGKVTSDAQLLSDATDEDDRLAKMPPASGLDEYGGSKSLGWSAKPSGFYRVERHNGVWWLITPSGLPCFYTGVCNAPLLSDNGTPVKGRDYLFADLPPQSGKFAPAWSPGVWGENNNLYFAFDTANLIRKLGPTHWQDKGQSVCVQRLRAFGFTGLGKWTDPFGGLPYVAVLSHPDDPKSGTGKLDVFDPAACERFRATIAAQVQPHRRDPRLLGWSVGNEMDEIVRTDELAAMLAAPSATPAKVAMVRHAIETIYRHDAGAFAAAWHTHGDSPQQLAAAPLAAPATDLEPLRHFYAAAYYQFIYQTVKSLDTDHLYLGFWIVPGWWMNDSDWGLITPYCDVIGYDHYDPAFADARLLDLFRRSDKPVLCGEFSFPPTYGGARGLGTYAQANAPDDATAGRLYQAWLGDAAANPYCVGTMWFEYRDEPLTGRGPGRGPSLVYDEHYAFGIVDVTDEPKWDLVTAMRSANLEAIKRRQKVSRTNDPS